MKATFSLLLICFNNVLGKSMYTCYSLLMSGVADQHQTIYKLGPIDQAHMTFYHLKHVTSLILYV